MEEYHLAKSKEESKDRYDRAYMSLGRDTFRLDVNDDVDIHIIDKALRIAAFGDAES
jgi:hypothetical protein